MSGEHEAQLSNAPTQPRFSLDQIDFQASFGQVNGGAHPPDAATDD